uniref:CCHC-type domain-containing protein n=1 Tax=Tanacetum cinerariifolium TaxID=118510 RepID=A0A699HVF9_TANCI|nr:hypothetical protein [Tanacetum cinerariifolium]
MKTFSRKTHITCSISTKKKIHRYKGRGTRGGSSREAGTISWHGDQFDTHPNPQPGNMNGWVDDHDDVEEKDDENEDVDIVEDDDAEIIFSYEVQGDQTPPPGDESSDYEFEVEEADDEVEEAGESSTARDLQFVGGLAPWALRRDLEALRRQDRIREAESGTSRTDIALLGSEARIGKMERETLHHDLSGVEETLRNVVERLKVLESGVNTTLRKKLADKEMLLDLTRMDRDRAERRLSESIWWNERFYLKMVRKGAVPKPPSDDEGSELPRKMPKKSDGDEGPSDPRGPLMIMSPKPMSEARMREIIRDQFATSLNEFMANMNNEAGGSGEASGAGGGGNVVRTGVRGAGLTVPELTGCTYVTFIKCDPLPFNGTEDAVGLCQWIMPPKPMSEARMREIIRDQFATSMNEFMANMNNGAGGSGGAGGAGGGGNAVRTGVRGVGPTVPELTGCTYVTFTKCDPLPFNGTESAVGLYQWFEKLESVFQISECKEKDKVKFAMATLRGRALTWWRVSKLLTIPLGVRMKGMDIDGHTNRFHELTLLCPRMVEPEAVKDKADEATGSEKRKGEGDRGGRGDNRREHNRRQNQRRGNAGAMTNAAPNNNETCQKCKNMRHAEDCWKCTKCGKLGHQTQRCRIPEGSHFDYRR